MLSYYSHAHAEPSQNRKRWHYKLLIRDVDNNCRLQRCNGCNGVKYWLYNFVNGNITIRFIIRLCIRTQYIIILISVSKFDFLWATFSLIYNFAHRLYTAIDHYSEMLQSRLPQKQCRDDDAGTTRTARPTMADTGDGLRQHYDDTWNSLSHRTHQVFNSQVCHCINSMLDC